MALIYKEEDKAKNKPKVFPLCSRERFFYARKALSDKDRIKKSKNRLIIKLHAQNMCEKTCKIRIHKNKTYVYVTFYNNVIFTKLKIEHIMLIEINGL